MPKNRGLCFALILKIMSTALLIILIRLCALSLYPKKHLHICLWAGKANASKCYNLTHHPKFKTNINTNASHQYFNTCSKTVVGRFVFKIQLSSHDRYRCNTWQIDYVINLITIYSNRMERTSWKCYSNVFYYIHKLCSHSTNLFLSRYGYILYLLKHSGLIWSSKNQNLNLIPYYQLSHFKVCDLSHNLPILWLKWKLFTLNL